VNITLLELHTKDLRAQRSFYGDLLGLQADLSASTLDIQVGTTVLRFTEAPAHFDGAYHFAFNIPENQIRLAKEWISAKTRILHDENKLDEFDFSNWNAHSFYFKDAAGNILECIARHTLKNRSDGEFTADQLLGVSEIGLPSENVIAFAEELCARLDVSVFRQEPEDSFTPVGDDNGLLILAAKGRIWYPNTGVPAALLPIVVRGNTNGREWEVRGVPYEIRPIG
jgi:catechol 2,3-dioxygenase-like lactoylglutathione lyase family enzyme